MAQIRVKENPPDDMAEVLASAGVRTTRTEAECWDDFWDVVAMVAVRIHRRRQIHGEER
jgi:hypothetical protein